MAYEYTITIKNEASSNNPAAVGGGINPGTTPGGGGGTAPGKPKEPKSFTDTDNYARLVMLKTVAIGQAKQYTTWMLSNASKYTGDSALQQNINNGIEGANLALGMVTNPAMTALSTTFGIVKNVTDHYFDDKKESMKLSVTRARNGYKDSQSIVTSRRH